MLTEREVIGKRVLLIGKHPWAGHAGAVEGFDSCDGRVFGMRVKLDNGMTAGVLSAKEFRVIEVTRANRA